MSSLNDVELPELTVSQFVDLHNQVLEYAMPSVVIVGELSSFRVSKNKWLYFDLKDDQAMVKFFGTIYQLPGPLEDGMMLKVRGTPRVHPQFGFSISISSIQLAGEGTLKKAANLLQKILEREGLFDPERKRPLPYPPASLGVIASKASAAYADVTKVLAGRWGGLDITLADVQVQGEPAPGQIVNAIEQFNQLAHPPEVLLITRGGGSAEDLAAFNNELVVRAVAASRIPTMVAVGHEVDVSLAELAADVRASTPSNAAELLTPDRKQSALQLQQVGRQLDGMMTGILQTGQQALRVSVAQLDQLTKRLFEQAATSIASKAQILELLSPQAVLARGYAIVCSQKTSAVIRGTTAAMQAHDLAIEFADGTIQVSTNES